MNVRRFFPAWGSDLALEAFLRTAEQRPDARFVMLGGEGTAGYVQAARAAASARGFGGRFTFFDGDLPFAECRALMSAADVGVSLMRERDMRPLASILEAAAAGAALVLGDQDEYRAMEALGFRAILTPPGDVDAVVAALARLLARGELRAELAEGNRSYLDAHEDGPRQARDLLARVRALRDGC